MTCARKQMICTSTEIAEFESDWQEDGGWTLGPPWSFHMLGCLIISSDYHFWRDCSQFDLIGASIN